MPPEHRRIVAPASTAQRPLSNAKPIESEAGAARRTGPGFSSGYSPHAMHMPYMMMGMQGSMLGGSNPIAWVYSLNQTIYSLSYALDMIGMNNLAIQQLYQRLLQLYLSLIIYIKRSKARIWLQEKCKKSKILRMLVVCSTMFITFQVMRVIRANNRRQKASALDVLGTISS